MKGGEWVPELEELYREVNEKLYKYIMNLSGDSHMAEEIVQETFYRAIEHMLLSKTELKTSWFYTVAKHLYFDYIKSRKRQIPMDKFDREDDYPENLPDINVLRLEESQLINKVLSQLKDSYRQVLELREFKQLSYEEISSLTSMSIDQVRVTLYRARLKFKELYKKEIK